MNGVNLNPTLTNQEAHDLLVITQGAIIEKGLLTVLQSRHNFPVMNQWFKKHETVEGGTMLEKQIMVNPRGAFQFTRPYAASVGGVTQSMATLRAPWALAEGRYDISQQEIDMNRSDRGMIKIVKTRRAPCELATAEGMEVAGFGLPTAAQIAGPHPPPYGLQYWIVPITGAQVTAHAAAVVATTEKACDTGTHQGANPSGFSDCAGLNASLEVNALYRNYNDVWSNSDCLVTEDDVDKMIRLVAKLKFDVPMNATDWASEANTYRAYCSYARWAAMNRKARENNDSLGPDLSKFHGQVVVAGVATAWNEELDAVTSDPWIAVDLSQFKAFVLAGNFFRETAYAPVAAQPDVHSTITRTMFQFLCPDRRRAGGRIDWVAAA